MLKAVTQNFYFVSRYVINVTLKIFKRFIEYSSTFTQLYLKKLI